MSEGWEDCPVLPVGWKRREVFRRSGATIGKSDTYYLSPTAERFRSKVELVKYFGDALDLTYFDFKKGIILPPDAKVRRSGKRQSTSSCEVKEEQRDRCQTPKKKAKAPPAPSPAQPKPEKASEAEGLAADPQDSLIVCCEDCQQWIPGVLFSPRKRRLRFYCAECRAKRRELGRKLNYYKRFGCGECEGCAVAADCGACRGCTAGHTNSGRRRKCIRRSCQKLKEIKAESRCRRSSGEPKKKVKSHLQTTKRTATQRPEPAYVTSEDKDGAPCKVPTRKIQSHQQAEKILKRAKINPVPKEPEVEEEKPVVKPCPPLSEEPAPESPDTPTAVTADTPVQTKGSRNRRNNRSCGECEACLRLADCGTCDFCKDKAKFGGANTLRQKCRWKQCLCFASKRLLPRELMGQGSWAEWEPGCRSGRRRWKENAFASRKVARAIQAARKRKICQSSAPVAEPEASGRPEAPAQVLALIGKEEEPSRPRTSSPERGQEAAMPSPVKPVRDSSGREDNPHSSPEQRSPPSGEALNLKKLLMVMKPYVKGAQSSEAPERPSVIRETSEWQLSSEQRRPVETPVFQTAAISTPAKRVTPEREPERIPSTTEMLSEHVSSSHQSVSPVIKQQDHKEKASSRKALQRSTEERDVNGCSSQGSPPVTKEERTTPSSNRQPISPKRPAETEARTPGIPSNSRIVRRESPEQNPGYGQSPPAAITQIFSLGSPYMMMSLEPLLRNFMQDLMLLPLPASWVVCSSLGPDVQLIQLSRKSPVWDAAVHIRPGFFFQVLVRGLAVPRGHRLYRSHPAQLTTVDDVVDLISDLETYRVCAGYPQHRSLKATPPAVAALLPRERSSFCEVLVDKERCFQCAITI